jgi:uncharacterized protein YndB with AHSA1/START domain
MSIQLGEVFIERPIKEVFLFISNMENGPRWGRTAATSKDSDGPVSVGTVFLEEADEDGRHVRKVTEVTEFDPPTRFSYTSRYENGVSEQAAITFETVDGGTLVTPAAEVEIPGVPQEQESAFSEEMETAVGVLLRSLKEVIESSD